MLIKPLMPKLYLSFITLSILSNLVHNKCVFYQPSTTDRPLAATTVDQQTPKVYEDPGIEFLRVCPDYIGKEVCCNDASRQLLLQNFMKLAMIVECQNCKNNIYRMM